METYLCAPILVEAMEAAGFGAAFLAALFLRAPRGWFVGVQSKLSMSAKWI